MKKLLAVTAIAAALFAVSAFGAAGDWTVEVLVLNSAQAELPVMHPTRRGALIQNLGPNTIYCATGAQADGGGGAVLTKSLAIVSTASLWMAGAPRIFCRAGTADQVTGAATIVAEVP